jgi:hypothetical protein
MITVPLDALEQFIVHAKQLTYAGDGKHLFPQAITARSLEWPGRIRCQTAKPTSHLCDAV